MHLDAGAHRRTSRQNLRRGFSESCSGHAQCSLPLEPPLGVRPPMHSSGTGCRAEGSNISTLVSCCLPILVGSISWRAVGWGLFFISFVSACASASQCECPGVSELSFQPVLGGEGSIPGSPQVLTQVAKPVSVGKHMAMSYDLGQGDFDPDSLHYLE